APASNDPAGTFAIQHVNMGEPFISCFSKGLTIEMKVPTMDPGSTGSPHPPPDGLWRVLFHIPGSANSFGTEQTLFVEFNSTLQPTGIFDYGWIDPATSNTCSQCSLNPTGVCADTGTIAPDGTITYNLDFSSTVSFGTCASSGGSTMT